MTIFKPPYQKMHDDMMSTFGLGEVVVCDMCDSFVAETEAIKETGVTIHVCENCYHKYYEKKPDSHK